MWAGLITHDHNAFCCETTIVSNQQVADQQCMQSPTAARPSVCCQRTRWWLSHPKHAQHAQHRQQRRASAPAVPLFSSGVGNSSSINSDSIAGSVHVLKKRRATMFERPSQTKITNTRTRSTPPALSTYSPVGDWPPAAIAAMWTYF